MTGKKFDASWLQRQIARVLVLVLVAPLAHASAAQQSPQNQTTPQTQQQPSTQQQPAPANTNTAQPALPNEPQNHTQQQTPAPIPVGTAAAPLETPVGTAVSRPAGAAIAPAKQKRSHTFLIRVGLVVGAAVAIGTVVALSKASRSRPQ